MEPYILFLGTGGDELVIGKQIRKSGGIVINTDDVMFHLNPGPGALNCLKESKLNVREISVILVSSPEQKYSAEVMALIEAMTLNGLDVKGVLVAGESALNGKDNLLPVVSPHHRAMLERVVKLEPEQRVGIMNTEIVALPCSNGGIGFKMSSENFVLSYLPETRYIARVPAMIKNSDILILNVKTPFGFENGADISVKLINESKPKLVVITGFGIKMLKEDPKLVAREIHRRTKTQVISAEDGLLLKPLSYVSKRSQKRLNSF